MLFPPSKQVLNLTSNKESKSISQALKPEIKLNICILYYITYIYYIILHIYIILYYIYILYYITYILYYITYIYIILHILYYITYIYYIILHIYIILYYIYILYYITYILYYITYIFYIGQNQIKEVTYTIFLGIQFDPLLNWSAHIQTLRKKLISCFAVTKRISTFIPRENYKNIYHTLFESHLSYCISVWGGANKSLMNKLFTVQKRCIRYLFGDYTTYKDKFCTSARTWPFGEQRLGCEFYCKENTKPLFTRHKILTVHNLHKYMTVSELSKIIYSKAPSIIYHDIKMSTRNNRNLIILPKNLLARNQFQYISSHY